MRKTEDGSFSDDTKTAKERFKEGLETGHAKFFLVALVAMIALTIVLIAIK